MVNPPVVGYRFRPTDEEIVENYLRLKNGLEGDTSHVDGVIATINIRNFDPWELPAQSIMKSGDQVWYFFGRKENKYNSGDRQVRKTKSGFWKKTGKPMEIKRKSGSHEKIGEKWVLVFHLSKNPGGSRTKWVMHEYHATPSSNHQMTMTYTLCKVKFKGEASEISHPPRSGETQHNHSSIPQVLDNFGRLSTISEGTSFECPKTQEIENPQHLSTFISNISTDGEIFKHDHSSTIQMNNLGGLSTRSEMGTSFECPQNQELENPLHLSDYLYMFEDMQFEDTMGTAISHLLNNDDYEQRTVMSTQEDRNDHIPKKSITGVLM